MPGKVKINLNQSNYLILKDKIMKANEDYPYQSKGKLFQYEFITKLILLYSDKQIIINLKDALRNEQLSRQERVSFTMKFDLENKYLLIY
jgi:hypothetical protein